MAFSRDTLMAAFRRSEGRCECTNERCEHGGRCQAQFEWTGRTMSDPREWEAHRLHEGDDSLENCALLCIPCRNRAAPPSAWDDTDSSR
jgi:hypothetical protein